MSATTPLILHIQLLWAKAIMAFNMLFARLLFPQVVPPHDLSDKTAIITGGNSGIGFSLARYLAQRNASICLACRNIEKGHRAAQKILETVPNASITVLELDTASFKSVRAFAEAWERKGKEIDVLVHNAGGPGPNVTTYTADGFEVQYQQNFLSSFLLTNLLEEYLAPDARVIFTSSGGAYSGAITPYFSTSTVQKRLDTGFHNPVGTPPEPQYFYNQGKLMQVVFAKTLQKHFDSAKAAGGKRRIASAFHPGLTDTPIFGKIEEPNAFFRSVISIVPYLAIGPDEGAKTGLYLATSDDEDVVERGAGGYWDRMRRSVTNVSYRSGKERERDC